MLTEMLSGGLVGALGRLGQAGLEFYQAREERKAAAEARKLEMDHELSKSKLDNKTKLALGRMSSADKRVEVGADLAAKNATEYTKALSVLHDSESKVVKSYPWVAAIRALVRPVILVLSVLAVITFGALGIDNPQASLVAEITMMAVTYYFLDRSIFKKNGQ